jgi:hypothetical protein
MPSIDVTPLHFIQKAMSRPFRLVLPVVFLTGALGFTGCVGTIYDNTYSYNKNHFKPPEDKGDVSAQSILGALEKKGPAPGADAGLPGGPPPGGEVPGLPPAGLPDAGGIPAPAAPAAPPAAPPPPNN